MYYKIGEFANLLGVTADTLRHYEKLGIISPLKEDNSSYRYFDDLDCRNILRSRWLRSFDVSMSDTAHLITKGSLHEIRETFANKSTELACEIQRLEGLLAESKRLKVMCDQMEDLLNVCTLEDFPGMYRICQTQKNALIKDRKIKKTVKEWMSLLPHTFFSFYISDKAQYKRKPENLNYGLGIGLEDATRLNLNIPSHVTLIPPSKCIRSYLVIKEGEFITNDVIENFENFALKNALDPNGHLLGKILFTDNHGGEIYNYFEVCLPVSSPST